MRNGVGVDDFNAAEPANAGQGGLATPVRTGNYEKGRHGRGHRLGQVDFRPGASSTRSPSFVRAI